MSASTSRPATHASSTPSCGDAMTMTGQWNEQPRDPAPGLFLLLSALQRLSFRAGEPGAWAAPLAEDPIAFLLDTVGEVVNVWTTAGELVYSNHAPTERT